MSANRWDYQKTKASFGQLLASRVLVSHPRTLYTLLSHLLPFSTTLFMMIDLGFTLGKPRDEHCLFDVADALILCAGPILFFLACGLIEVVVFSWAVKTMRDGPRDKAKVQPEKTSEREVDDIVPPSDTHCASLCQLPSLQSTSKTCAITTVRPSGPAVLRQRSPTNRLSE